MENNINQYYLKQTVTRSDIIAFFIILFGFFVSFLHLISKLFGIPIPEHPGTDNPDDAHSTLKSQRYNYVVKSVAGEAEEIKIEEIVK